VFAFFDVVESEGPPVASMLLRMLPFAVQFVGLTEKRWTDAAETTADGDREDIASASGSASCAARIPEAAPAFDPAMQVRPAGDLPLAWFAVFDAPLAMNPASASATAAPARRPRRRAGRRPQPECRGVAARTSRVGGAARNLTATAAR
jgi:hypothetical protein